MLTMGLFKKLIGDKNSKNETPIDRSNFKKLEKPKPTNFQDFFEQHAGLSFEKQLVFADLIGSDPWELDMGIGKIIFGEKDFPIQIIGSLSFNDNSWMWGWANTKSGIPENLLNQSLELKRIGEEYGIKELVDSHFNVEESFEHKMGILACGVFKANSYYCANYGQGTLVVTIDDSKIPKIDPNRVEKVLTSFPQLINGMELNHKNALINYLIDREFDLNIGINKIEGLKNKNVLIADFENKSILKSLDAKMQA